MYIYLIPILTIIAAWIAISLPLYLMFRPKQFQLIWNALRSEINKVIIAELNTSNVTNKLINKETLAELTPTIETHIDQFLRVKLLEKMPFLSTFLGESTLVKLKTGMMEEIELLLPKVVEQCIGKTSSSANISELIQHKMNNINTDKIVISVRSTLAGKIATMKWIAVMIGLLVGLIQVIILLI